MDRSVAPIIERVFDAWLQLARFPDQTASLLPGSDAAVMWRPPVQPSSPELAETKAVRQSCPSSFGAPP